MPPQRPRPRPRSPQSQNRTAPDMAEADSLSPAFYARRGGARWDWWTVLHPPYTLWHLSYAAIGAALAPHLDWLILGATLVAFTLAVGIAAHGHQRQSSVVGGDRGARGRGGARDRGAAAYRTGVDPVRGGRGRSRTRIQPRTLRRRAAHRPRIRPRVGGVPRGSRLRRAGARVQFAALSRRCRRRYRRDGSLCGAAAPEHARAHAAPTSGERDRCRRTRRWLHDATRQGGVA